ncbi:MAG: DinB family protein [Dehalococcoidia bacterium]|nr:DinB family protein [Dehalococcoidia bacterium]
MDAKAVVQVVLKRNHDVFQTMLSDLTPEGLHWAPPGVANPAGALWAHVVISEDMMFNRVIRGEQAPLYETSWLGRTGLSEPREQPGVPWGEWARRLHVDAAQCGEYTRAVFAATESYLEGVDAAEMDRMVTIHIPNRPPMAVAAFLASVLSNHVANHVGEISGLKGLQGLRGYQG